MRWEDFHPSRATGTCIVLLTFSFLLMTFRLTETVQMFRSFLIYWISPTQEVASTTVRLGRDVGFRLGELVGAHRENILLKEKMKGFLLMESQHRETAQENRRLKELVNFKSSFAAQVVPAMVSARDTQNWMSAVWIDQGSENGVAPDSPVIAIREQFSADVPVAGGVIGRVLECTARSSKVLLISDPLSSIAIAFPRTGEQGLASGKGAFAIEVDYLDPAADIQVGEETVTSGLGGIFPAGLSVGRLTKVTTSPSGFKKGELKTTVSLNSIKEVLVLVPQRGTAQP